MPHRLVVAVLVLSLTGCEADVPATRIGLVPAESETERAGDLTIYVRHYVVTNPPRSRQALKQAITDTLAGSANGITGAYKLYAYFYRGTPDLDESFTPRLPPTCFRDCGELFHIWDFAEQDQIATVFVTGKGCDTWWSWRFHRAPGLLGRADRTTTERISCSSGAALHQSEFRLSE